VCSQSQVAECSESLFNDRHPGVEKITLTDERWDDGNLEGDWSCFVFTTDDQSLGETLESLKKRHYEVRTEVGKKMINRYQQSGHVDVDGFIHLSPTLVLSFPHGQDLCVTLGMLWKLEWGNTPIIQLTAARVV